MKYITCVFIAIIIFVIGFFAGKYHSRGKDWISYERGAHVIALYHKNRGNYGSKAFRDAAFKWGDPQDEEDLKEIEAIQGWVVK